MSSADDPLPLVSIVTPNYNYAHYLGLTIESVLRQDYPRLEYIVVDDGSTDDSPQLVEKYQEANPGRIRLIQQENAGQSAAINHGFSESEGEILGWLNSDDLLEPSAVSIAVDYLLRHPGVGMVFADRVVIDGKGNFLHRQPNCYWGRWHFRHNCIVAQETSFWRRELFYDAGALDETLRYCMDYDLFIRFALRTRIGFVPIVLGSFRSHEQSKTIKAKKGVATAGEQELQRTLRAYFGSRRSRLVDWLIFSPLGWLLRLVKRRRLRPDKLRAMAIQAEPDFWGTGASQAKTGQHQPADSEQHV